MEPDTQSTAPPADEPASDDPSSDGRASSRRLAPGGGPLHELKNHAQGLSEDVRAWLEMRFELAKIEVWEHVDEQTDQLVLFAITGALGAVGGLVMLLATCFGVSWIISALTGWTIGALFLGFLAVALAFIMLAALVFATKPRFGFFEDKTRAIVSEERVLEGRTAGERVAPGGSSRSE